MCSFVIFGTFTFELTINSLKMTSTFFKKNVFTVSLLIFIVFSFQPITAQKEKKSKKGKTEAAIEKKEDKISIIDIAKKSIPFEGLLQFIKIV